ncbi:phosphomevalonate kinase [Microbacterium sp. cx-55]|uniref:phosphomevalonate kinase n=1 Tax=Microbacterium sp. cx-55 TaxID=2875948 RepID=UPI001CBAA0B5|nr:phosphomevalonate kinase [Microbacterium sp. cx-55]MBZ4486393.1 phosphomevalonate kinase [Microbacterium sp. cx-55]UGB36632.1 phosphomevalonate kinase [Microbacterium sp. cx-55]
MNRGAAARAETITVRAPGKLFIAGEYAVVSPGEPSVLVAVDRYLTVGLTESVGAGSIHSPEYGRMPVVWTRSEGGLTVDREHHPYDYVFEAITVAERLRAERGLAPRFFDLRIDSGLDDVSGRKFGLGSSAAVTVATVRAIDRFYGFDLSPTELFQIALLATIQVAPTASGGDLAASTFGGWIGYRAPDRELLRQRTAAGSIDALLRDTAAWEGLEIRRLSAPRDLSFLVGWTGAPASTERLVDAVGRRSRAGSIDHTAFLEDSRRCVNGLWTSLETGDDSATLGAVNAARHILQGLGAQSGVSIETPALRALCEVAESIGAAAKPSGAGGGDCGIVLAPAGADVAGMLRAWEAHDIRHLTVSVHAPEAEPA